MKKWPYIQFFTGDWLKASDLTLCSPATRGIWIDLICFMHDNRTGEVTGSLEQLSRMSRCNPSELHSAIRELQSTGTGEVAEKEGVWTVGNRRLLEMARISKVRAAAGSKGGSKNTDINEANDTTKAQSKLKQTSGTEDEDRREEGSVRGVEITRLLLRAKSLFRMRPTTPLDVSQNRAWKNSREAIIDTSEDEWNLLEWWFSLDGSKAQYRRRDLATLLNNWNGEIARAGTAKQNGNGHSRPSPLPSTLDTP